MLARARDLAPPAAPQLLRSSAPRPAACPPSPALYATAHTRARVVMRVRESGANFKAQEHSEADTR